MCGIFGLGIQKDSGYSGHFIDKALRSLAHSSESRGKDSSGLVFRDQARHELRVIKGAVCITALINTRAYATAMQRTTSSGGTFAAMGHSRLVTNGSQITDNNNQPVVKDGVIGIHNGIIVNGDDLWQQHYDLKRTYEIDTEVMLALIRKYTRNGLDLASAIGRSINSACGTVSAALFVDDHDALAVATNNGSLYVLTNDRGLFAFASEEYFLTTLSDRMRLQSNGHIQLQQVQPGAGLVLNLRKFLLKHFSFCGKATCDTEDAREQLPYNIVTKCLSNGASHRQLIVDPATIAVHPRALTESAMLEFNLERIQAIRRCTKCLLPETFPFIQYDEYGTCNYCVHYKIKNIPRPIDELLSLVDSYRNPVRGHDCIIPYSGGRDSTYTLHIAKTVLKLNPVAFTYDWGMVTDLARRNIARVCGKLGVENILISADISWKRENIRKNILAWLRKPHMGMVPLFMAGDKWFYYYTDQVKKQTGIRLNIWGINPLENTDFKVGFLGVQPDHDKERIYSLSARRQAKLFASIAQVVLRNPRYLNRSIFDTFGGFVARSIIPHRDYFHLFDYCRWDEAEIETLVRDEYDWETAVDTPTTWRIGDGTAAFYNYIYYTVAGFSEYDTFRSNQIREGMLTREQALNLVNTENCPRYASIKWYTEILNLDFSSTVKRINDIPKLYS